MSLKITGNGVRQSPHGSLSRFCMVEDAEFGLEKLVSSANRYVELDPVSCGCDRS